LRASINAVVGVDASLRCRVDELTVGPVEERGAVLGEFERIAALVHAAR
jgi:hypothetical protein